MATATITPSQDAVLAEVFIAAPPERVFEAITDPTQLSKWWGEPSLYRITERSSDVRPGGKWFSAGVGADGTKFAGAGTKRAQLRHLAGTAAAGIAAGRDYDAGSGECVFAGALQG